VGLRVQTSGTGGLSDGSHGVVVYAKWGASPRYKVASTPRRETSHKTCGTPGDRRGVVWVGKEAQKKSLADTESPAP